MSIDGLQHALDLRPAIDVQQDFAAGTDEGKRLNVPLEVPMSVPREIVSSCHS
jgi:hypothetical protein